MAGIHSWFQIPAVKAAVVSLATVASKASTPDDEGSLQLRLGGGCCPSSTACARR